MIFHYKGKADQTFAFLAAGENKIRNMRQSLQQHACFLTPGHDDARQAIKQYGSKGAGERVYVPHLKIRIENGFPQFQEWHEPGNPV
jgi:hypothetical protein